MTNYRLDILRSVLRRSYKVKRDSFHYVLVNNEDVEIYRTLILSSLISFCYDAEYITKEGRAFF